MNLEYTGVNMTFVKKYQINKGYDLGKDEATINPAGPV